VVLVTDADGQIPLLIDQLVRAHGHRLVGVVTGPGPKNRRTTIYHDIVRNTPPDVDVIVTSHPKRLARMLEPLKPDLILTLGFLRVLPQDVLDLPRLGAINTHGGVLPKYRGPNPPGWAFRNEEGEIGWTVHRMTAGIDEGPILAVGAVPYGDDDDFESLFPKWTGLIPGLISQALTRVVAGDPGDPQDEAVAGYAPHFDADWREIDWSQPARSIHNQVRSWVGGPRGSAGAFGEIDGKRTLIVKTHLVADARTEDVPPGTLLDRSDDRLTIQCGDGPLEILKWEAAE
jgi:methionyl-tRNA formyltransferase